MSGASFGYFYNWPHHLWRTCPYGPPLSLLTRNNTTLMCVRLSKAEVGFDWQLYVTTHSSLVAFCWVWPSTIFTRAIRRIHITAQ